MPKLTKNPPNEVPKWIHELRHLQNNLDVLRQACSVDFYHGMIAFHGNADPERVAEPRFYSGCGVLVDSFAFSIGNNRSLVHYVFVDAYYQSEAKSQYDKLKKLFSRIDKLVSTIPKKILPEFDLLPTGDGSAERMRQWLSVLHHLGTWPENRSFQVELEFLADLSTFDNERHMQPWSECSTVSEFDPSRYLLFESHKNDKYAEWRRQFEQSGRSFPEVIASSLTKPVIYASLNGIDKIVDRFGLHERSNRAGDACKAKTQKESNELSPSAEFVLKKLREHHRCGTSAPYFAPIKQIPFSNQINVSQKLVSVQMNELMKLTKGYPTLEGAAKYKKFCDEGVIDAVLDFLATPNSMKERLSSELHQVKDDLDQGYSE